MSTHAVPIVRVKLEDHPDADALSVVKILGWQVCVRTADWKDGDLGAYVAPDFMVPLDREVFAFLRDPKRPNRDKYRIRVKRLRGLLSQGLLVPAPQGSTEGDNVIDALGVERYEPPVIFKSKTEDTGAPDVLHYKYDVENLQNYPNVLEIGEDVVVSEKIHGCVLNNTRIVMANGERKRITRVQPGEYVLGHNGRSIVPTKVLNVFNNGPSDTWLKIKTTRFRVGKGNYFCSVKCTPNHQFWNGERYTEAQNLEVNDKVYSTRTDLTLSPLQKQVILGKLLGDAFFGVAPSKTAHIAFNHKQAHQEYVEWTERGLGSLVQLSGQDNLTSGFGSALKRSRTINSFQIYESFNSMIGANHVKFVPEWVEHALTPIAIAFWYMDDGSLGHHEDQEDRANFAVCGFTQQDCDVLIRGLKKFDINATYHQADGYSRLRLNADDAEKLFLLIAPYVPQCVQYKLPERYRGHAPFLPSHEYKPQLIAQTIVSIKDITSEVSSNKYDLETETHNFFAGEILVHNSNARYVFHDGQMFVGSRTRWKKENAENPWWIALKNSPWLQVWCEAHPDHVVYGEIFGQVQNLRYGSKPGEIFFRAFDILKDGHWLDYDTAIRLIQGWLEMNIAIVDNGSLHLPDYWVPVIYRGPFMPDVLKMAEGQSAIPGADHYREGIVIRPTVERGERRLGRVQLKVVSETYLTKSK